MKTDRTRRWDTSRRCSSNSYPNLRALPSNSSDEKAGQVSWNKDGIVAYVYGTSYCSTFVDSSTPPAVLFDTYYPVSVTMKNSCPATWKTNEVVLRVSGDWNWTPNAVPPPRDIGFGQSIKFAFNVKTPRCFSIGGFGYCGDERFVWRMKKGTMDFGESTPLLKVQVGWEAPPAGDLGIPSDPIADSPLPYGRPVPTDAPPPPLLPQAGF